jgi:uncharacterized membrane protein YhaH (DUF805 family)
MNWLFGFSGRITRLDWWLAQLVILCALLALVFVVISMGASVKLAGVTADENGNLGFGVGLSMILVILATGGLLCWINIATSVKRFHDRNKSGFWVLIILVPYIGSIWQIVECGFLAGTRGGNDYGSGGSGGGSRDLDKLADQLAVEYGGSRTNPESGRSAGIARAQTEAPPPRRASQSGFGRRGTG